MHPYGPSPRRGTKTFSMRVDPESVRESELIIGQPGSSIHANAWDLCSFGRVRASSATNGPWSSWLPNS
jgi:hypothetical protein